MINDPELKAMSEVFEALEGLDESTQKRVVDWVLAKLQSPSTASTKGAKRGPKPGSKRGKKRGRQASGKIGRPPGSLNKDTLDISGASKKRGRGRPKRSRSKAQNK